jgi:hypothetical protein
MTNTTVGRAYIEEGVHRLQAALDRIRHCVDQLDDAQVWWRPQEAMNSIANLLLHLCGNLTQWIIAGIRGQDDQRDRPSEFAVRAMIPKAELLGRLEKVITESQQVLAQLSDAQLLEPRRIQGFEGTVLSATFDSLTHLTGHVQEIIYITRLQLGDKYRFAWVPTTPEQGAPRS